MTAGVIDYVLPLPAGTLWEETPVIKEPKLRRVFANTGPQAGQTTGGLSGGGATPFQLLTPSEK